MANVDLQRETAIEGISVRSLAEHWWALAVRGVVAVMFGALLILAPGIGLFTLLMLFGAYVLVDGVFNLVAAVHHAQERERWGSLAFSGVVSVLAGLFTFTRPGISAYALLMVIAAWCVITGIAQIIAAVRLREVIKGEWLLGLSGLISVAFGIALVVAPGAGALALMLYIGAYEIALGVLLLGFAYRLRSWRRSEERPPLGGVPTPA